jgi:hypothetical protein
MFGLDPAAPSPAIIAVWCVKGYRVGGAAKTNSCGSLPVCEREEKEREKRRSYEYFYYRKATIAC